MSHLPSWRPGTNHLESYSANNWLGGGVTLDFIHEPDYISAIFGLPEKSKVTLSVKSAEEAETKEAIKKFGTKGAGTGAVLGDILGKALKKAKKEK